MDAAVARRHLQERICALHDCSPSMWALGLTAESQSRRTTPAVGSDPACLRCAGHTADKCLLGRSTSTRRTLLDRVHPFEPSSACINRVVPGRPRLKLFA